MEEDFLCKENCPHFQKIEKVKNKEPNKENIQDLAEIFKIFADNTRLNIICALLKEELCVCDLCELLGLTQSNVSHQLKGLRDANLVKYRKEGKQIFYSLEDEHVEQIISKALEHVLEGRK